MTLSFARLCSWMLRVRGPLVLTGCALVAACASTAPDRFHSLSASELPAPAAAANGGERIVVDVAPVGVPPLVDAPEWVLRGPDDSLVVLEHERWAAPLRDELRSAVTERLVARWNVSDAHLLPLPAAAVWRVRVDLQRFETVPGREVRIDGVWSLLRPQPANSAMVCRITLAESVAETGIHALAAAHRRNVARLADQIGQALQTSQRGQTAACPG